MNMNVSLPDELAAYVEAKVSTGHYGSPSEVVREALGLMAKIEREESDTGRLSKAWKAGKASGVYGEIDFEVLRTEGRKRSSAARKAAGRAG